MMVVVVAFSPVGLTTFNVRGLVAFATDVQNIMACRAYRLLKFGTEKNEHGLGSDSMTMTISDIRHGFASAVHAHVAPPPPS